jgi:uncharacterized protein (DUF885 family)
MLLFKKILKIAGVLLGVVVLLGGLFIFHTWNYKPLTIDLFFARTFLKIGLESPEMLSSIRVLEPFGIKGHNSELDDESLAAGDRFMQQMKEAHEVLLSYEDEDLDAADLMSKRIVLTWSELLAEGDKFRFHNYPVNPLFGVQNDFPSFMESTHQVHSVGDAEDYVTRLSKAGIKFGQVLEGLQHREKLGIFPPQFVVTKVLEEMRNFVATPSEEGILMVALTSKMEEAGLPPDDQQRIARDARTAIENTVYPAYEQLISYFTQLDNRVEHNHGVWNLPDGDQLYALAIRLFTTTDYTPDYLHNFGLSEVERIQSQILEILEVEGWDVSGGFGSAIKEMADRDEFYYSDTPEGRESILADYQAIIDEVSEGLEPFFDVVHQSSVEVERIPEFREKTTPGAYYQRPSFDGSRPGTFYANLYDIKATPKYTMRTLAYHEAIPGHHLQIAIQQQQKGLPFFRRVIPFTAYTEGWALYAEQLAWELGFQEDPYDNIGRLQGELFRAVRLVVDTGIHAMRWSREEAIEYMATNTGVTESDVVTEIERYFVLPGQALAYKVGMTKILELRDRAQNELGENFDIRRFHNVVLTSGALPLNILEELIDQYIEETAAKDNDYP